MELTEHSQAIINSAKSIANARNFMMVEPEQILLALMYDENDLPKILLSKIGLDNPSLAQQLDGFITKRGCKPLSDYKDMPLSKNTAKLLEIARDEARMSNDSLISIEHLLLALLKIDSGTIIYLFEKNKISRKDVYEKLITVIRSITTVDIVSTPDTAAAPVESPKETAAVQKIEQQTQTPLQKYTVDITEKAKQNKLDPVIGRDDEIRRVIQILNRRSKNNPVIIGEPGVGKTAIIEGLAQRIACGDVPESLKNDRIMELDLGALLAGASYRGEFEDRLKGVLKEIEEHYEDLMLFIDEIHTIMGLGGSEGSVDAGNLLKPMLARGNVRVIGATTTDEYRKYIEKDKALERRFQPVIAEEPSVETTISILRGLKDKYEAYHGVKILDDAIVQAVKLSDRYISDRYLPDKAIDLIDEAASSLRIAIDTLPEEIDVYIREKMQLEIEKGALKKEHSKEAESKIQKILKKIETIDAKINKLKNQWAQEKKLIETTRVLKKNMAAIKAQLELNKKNESPDINIEKRYAQMAETQKKLEAIQAKSSTHRLIKEEIDGEDISEIISKSTGIPVTSLLEDESQKLVHMEDYLKKRVVGQDVAVKKISDAIRLGRSGLNDPKRPIGTFLFLGPTGVGKTELAKALSEFMFSDEDSLIRIDMSEFMEKQNVSRLVGSAPGYVGYEEGGQLTEAVRRKPYSVVLFDEAEKAHPDIFNIMLQMFDDGRLTDGQGHLIDFKNTVIIMTSNIASDVILNEQLTEHDKEQQIKCALRSKFKPEFINRIDEIISFNPLDIEQLKSIIDIQLKSLQARMAEQQITLEVTEPAKEYLAKAGYEPLYGARPLKRVLRKLLEIPLSMKIVANEFQKGDSVLADCVDNAIVLSKKTAAAKSLQTNTAN